MANGQVVLVTTQRLSGGSPMRAVYYVAEEDPTKAQVFSPTIREGTLRVKTDECDRFSEVVRL